VKILNARITFMELAHDVPGPVALIFIDADVPFMSLSLNLINQNHAILPVRWLFITCYLHSNR
jgi:hypothetical protein